MPIYHSLKHLFTQHILDAKKRLVAFNLKMNTRKSIKITLKSNRTPKLDSKEIEETRAYFKSKGCKISNTYWHQYYKSINGEFYTNYIPEDVFCAIISPKFNQMRQWPALLDKNLSYNLFKNIHQPKCVVQNINGFYYINGAIVSEKMALETCKSNDISLVIKPTIDSGNGTMVETFTVDNNITSFKNFTLLELFMYYKKDFIVQESVQQSEALASLNPSSLNTLRLMTYLKEDGTHVLSAVLRIGQQGSHTDNFSGGGIVCGIDKNGKLKDKGYSKDGKVYTASHTNVAFKGFQIPNYVEVLNMVKAMHPKVPYFKFISWDIGIDKDNSPIFIEYNTYYQDVDLHQITNGPLFGDFTDEILKIALKSKN
ncbi:sugar-transfer associated ATP-grasp domain-containing protein [Winogradskyella endarachnes]|uniref:Alpha-L-glutamate ligase-related protein ATP-grasp domain-containing protein n=1 Tax=Winogradskyella endarachnes TaxID=2681965 RepID=A0A6L6U4E9_9FLAO|nr:sugar-transfer associated ATP-grasp domain-containing protein [Winogradskyella endarachnes]MUU76953.1 hypothetical protein [Winogradskyella endarachnes]